MASGGMPIPPSARRNCPGKVIPLNISQSIGIAPDEIKDYLVKKKEQDAVQKDDVWLAENKPSSNVLKLKSVRRSPARWNPFQRLQGQILLREPPRILELHAYIDGTIAEVHLNQVSR